MQILAIFRADHDHYDYCTAATTTDMETTMATTGTPKIVRPLHYSLGLRLKAGRLEIELSGFARLRPSKFSGL